ncbi:MAG: MFS transporter [Gammaproteobacteria bacterium]|nr:MFS transporter [Gammaproteobacteria bacterium]
MSQPIPNPTTSPWRWAMLGGVWLLYFCFGLTVAAMAPLVSAIVRELDMRLAAMGAVLGAWPLVYIAAAVPCGVLLDRLGLRWSLALAAAVIAASGALRAAADSELGLFLAVAVFGLGGPLVSVGAPKLIGQWFAERERGLAMGIYITGPAIGGIVALALTSAVLMPWLDGRWRLVLVIYAGASLAAGLVWLWLSAHPAARTLEREGARRAPEAQIAVFARLLGAPAVRVVLLMSIGIFFFNHGLNNWLPEMLRAGGMEAARAGLWAALPTAVGIPAALLIPRLAVRRRRIAILVSLFVCAGLATLLLHGTATPLLAGGLVLQGIARGAMMSIAVLALMDAREVQGRNMGAAGGLFFAAAEIGGVLGPLTLGLVADATGGFDAALWLLTGVCVALTVLTRTLARHA